MRLAMILSFVFIFSNINAQFTEHVFSYDSNDYPFVNEVQLADMNGDGDLDYVTMGNTNRQVTVSYHNNFEAPIQASFVGPEALRFMVIHDFDQDGDQDLIFSAPFADTSLWYSNEGGGVFTEKGFPIPDYVSIIFEDTNADGVLDMVANVGNALNIYDYADGAVSLRKEVDFDSFSMVYKGLTAFDRDNDGLLEILASDAFDGIVLYEQTTADEFVRVDLLPNVFSVEKLKIVDFNDDGAFDIVASSAFNGTCKILINSGTDTFSETSIAPEEERIEFCNVIDYDSDGDTDIVYYDSGFGVDGKLFTYSYDNGSFVKEILSLDYGRLENGAAGDIDGDGDIDMLFGENPFFMTALNVFENTSAVSTRAVVDFDFEIYPTIVSDEVIINTKELVQYNIVDQLGRLVRSGENLGVNTIALGHVSSGVLYVQLWMNDSMITRKIVKVE